MKKLFAALFLTLSLNSFGGLYVVKKIDDATGFISNNGKKGHRTIFTLSMLGIYGAFEITSATMSSDPVGGPAMALGFFLLDEEENGLLTKLKADHPSLRNENELVNTLEGLIENRETEMLKYTDANGTEVFYLAGDDVEALLGGYDLSDEASDALRLVLGSPVGV